MIEPLNISALFRDSFAGNIYLFVGMLFIAILGLAARFRMPKEAVGIFIIVFGIFMLDSGASWILFLSLLIGGLITYLSISKLVK